MLTEYQKSKLIEWAEWTEAHDLDAPMPHGIDKIDSWAAWIVHYPSFPTTEQMEPTRSDFGLEG